MSGEGSSAVFLPACLPSLPFCLLTFLPFSFLFVCFFLSFYLSSLTYLAPKFVLSLLAEADQMDFEEVGVKEKEPITEPSLSSSIIDRRSSRSSRFSRILKLSMDQDALPLEVDEPDGRDLVTKSREALVTELQDNSNLSRQMLVLQELLKREGKDFCTPGGTVIERIDAVYKQAGYDKNWSVIRRGAGLLGKIVDSLAPGITTILVSGKVV